MKDYIALLSLLVACIGVGVAASTALYVRRRDSSKDNKEFQDKTNERLDNIERNAQISHAGLDKRLTLSESHIELFWKNLTITMGTVLHSPHPENARLDYLIERLQAEEISASEVRELIDNLKARTEDQHKKDVDTLAASLMLLGIRQQRESQIFAQALSDAGL